MKLAVPAIDFDQFHLADLPRRLARGNGPLAFADLKDAPPLAFRIPGSGGYTYVPSEGTVMVALGTSNAETIVELDLDSWRQLVCEYRTPIGLIYAGKPVFARGDYSGLIRWEAALWAMLFGRPVYDPSLVDLTGLDGKPLDLRRTFSLADSDGDLRHYFNRTGFALVKKVFSPAEVEVLAAEVMRLAQAAVPGDRRSWWAKNAAGDDLLTRLVYMGEKSPAMAALERDPRLLRLAALSPEPVAAKGNRMDSPAAILKVPGVTSGLADYPWHVDCGLGLHPIICPSVQVGIQLDPATPDSGQLYMLAGSWRFSCRQGTATSYADLPVVALETEPGDCTVHFGHCLHAAPPPGGKQGRRTIYVGFTRPGIEKVFGPGQGSNDVLYTSEDAFIPNADEIGKATSAG
jgi:ectoine hydroxylase-related dioxygenase (phytanoyl-CoA dioxygenase family)